MRPAVFQSFIFLCLISINSFASASAVLSIFSETNPIVVGDKVKIQIELSFENEPGDLEKIKIPTINNNRWVKIGPLSVDSFSRTISKNPQSENSWFLDYQAYVVSSQLNQIPRISIENSDLGETYTTDQFSFSADSILKQGDKQFLDLLKPIQTGRVNWALLYGTIILVVILLGIGIVYLIRRKKPDNQKVEISALDYSLKSLKDLQKNLDNTSSINLDYWKSFSYQLTAILKQYLNAEKRWAVLDLTDKELSAFLAKKQAQKREDVDRVFKESNEVRYGTKNLDKNIAMEHLKLIQNFIKENQNAEL